MYGPDRFQGKGVGLSLDALKKDALLEGDSLAQNLYVAMLKIRSEEDIPEKEFSEYIYLREQALKDAEEIWKRSDSMGNTLVSFIKECQETDSLRGNVFYVVVALEDIRSNSHLLLFSFPTRDKHLLDRYRQGEVLQAEEVVSESSH